MSEVRSPEAAPTDEPAVVSVETSAPEFEVSEVEDGSAPHAESKDFVPAARFNGLMGRFNRTQAELESMRESMSELEARLQAQQTTEETTPQVAEVDQDRIASLEDQLAELTGLIKSDRAQGARDKALKDFPEAAPFADLIVGDTDDDFRAMAQVISERLKGAGVTTADEATDTAETTTETTTTDTAPVPVVGGASTFSGEAATQEKVAEAIKAKDFPAFLRATQELQEAQLDAASLEG